MTPSLSVILPIYNVEEYLSECLDSLLSQTFKDFEIICINDGSTDNSLSILEKYADKDARFRLIDKKNEGYGKAINQGISLAKGDYVAVLETDDFIEPTMYEELYRIAEQHPSVDIIKSEYHFYWTKKDRIKYSSLIQAWVANKVIPASSEDYINCFFYTPSIWSALYRKAFLVENNIACLETRGASYQDISFNFKLWAYAKSAYLHPKALLYYRQDNEKSSINDKSKIYCVCTECAEIENFIEKNPKLHHLRPLVFRYKYLRYYWNFSRIRLWKRWDFLTRMKKEFNEDIKHPDFDKNLFPFHDWNCYSFVVKSRVLALFYFFFSLFAKVSHKDETWRLQLFGLRILKAKRKKRKYHPHRG